MGNKIIIVGGVAGGASFAARMRRLDESANIILFEKGKFISFANCGLPYHIGETIKDRNLLVVQTPEAMNKRFNIDIRTESEVTSVNTEKKYVTVKAGNNTYNESFDKLLLSPGAAPIIPPIPGINEDRIFTLRNIPDMDKIKEITDSSETSRAIVIGGGFIGIETAENLRHRGLDVSLVEMADQIFMPVDKEMASVLQQHMALNSVNIILEDGAKEFKNRDNEIEVILNSGRTLKADFIILAIGVKPDTAFLSDSGLSLTARGSIIVNKNMETNIENIYAVGDAIEVEDFVSGNKISVPLAGPANRQGRIAADNIAGIKSSYQSTQGTAVCKIFDMTAAVTGINEKSAKKWNIPYIKSYTHSLNHAGYYPGAFQMSVKILFSPENGKLLGAQIIGHDGIDKRIDVFATALRHKLSVYDLTELELSYAPPYGSAKDPVNMAGFVAQNILQKKFTPFYSEDVKNFDPTKEILLDVREKEETDNGTIKGSMLIPLDTLRNRISELNKKKEILVFCQVGLRGYLASRILEQNGFTVKNLSGGYKTYRAAITHDYDNKYIEQSKESVCSSPTGERPETATIEIDACGLQCPGPIMQMKNSIDHINNGETLLIKATDSGFAKDAPAWCARSGHTLISLNYSKGIHTAIIQKGMEKKDICHTENQINAELLNRKTMVVFSNDFDKAMATFIIANGAASMGNKVVLFFTFWGLNLLRKNRAIKVKKSFMENAFGILMPRGSKKVSLSKMNMNGLGTIFMKKEMKKKNVMSLEELISEALKNDVRFVACTMSMDIMGIKKEELIEGIEFGGVAAYLSEADKANYNLFI